MKRKMHYVVTLADYFEYFKPYVFGYGYDVPRGTTIWFSDLVIEFEERTSDIVKDADEELDKYIKENYPDKQYRIYYWTLERND